MVACDANMNPEDFKKSLWYTYSQRHQVKEYLPCRSTGPNETYDCVIASQNRNIQNMEVVEEFESRPQKAVTSLVERDKEIQELRIILANTQWWQTSRKKQGGRRYRMS